MTRLPRRRTAFTPVALALLLLSTAAAPVASGQTELAWKFAPGQRLHAERTARLKQSVEIQNTTTTHEHESTWNVTFDMKEKKGDAFRIQATMTRVVHKHVVGLKEKSPDLKLADALQGSVFTLHITPAGRVLDLHGYEEFLTRWLKAAGPYSGTERARRESLQSIFPETSLRDQLGDFFGPLSGSAVNPGDAWSRPQVEPMLHFGRLRSVFEFTVDGIADNRARIVYTIRTLHELPKAEPMVLFRILEGKIESEKSRGVLVFDAARRQVATHERSLSLRGTLKLETMGREHAIAFTHASEMALRFTKD